MSPAQTLHFTFITATPLSIAAGSGTALAIRGLKDGITALGHRVTIIAPTWRSAGPLYALRRWWFNRTLQPAQPSDVVVGFDMDGHTYPRRPGTPYVSVIYGQLADEARFERGFTRWSMLWQARFERRNAQRADLVIAPSASSAQRIVHRYGVAAESVAVVPPPFDYARWETALTSAPRRPKSGPVVLAVARLYPRKNLTSLVAAAPILRQATPGVRIRIAGNGPERRRLQRDVERYRVGDIVAIVGQLSFQQLVAEFKSADVFCLPSLQEGFGLVFLEAMTAGLPIVAVRASAIPELVADGVNGALVAPGDVESLASALAALLADPPRRAAIARRNREAVRCFAPTDVAARFLRALPLNPGAAVGVD